MTTAKTPDWRKILLPLAITAALLFGAWLLVDQHWGKEQRSHEAAQKMNREIDDAFSKFK